MALAVFFLLTGTLAAEVSVLGVPEVGYVGVALLLLSAGSLARLWWTGYPEPAAEPEVRLPSGTQTYRPVSP